MAAAGTAGSSTTDGSHLHPCKSSHRCSAIHESSRKRRSASLPPSGRLRRCLSPGADLRKDFPIAMTENVASDQTVVVQPALLESEIVHVAVNHDRGQRRVLDEQLAAFFVLQKLRNPRFHACIGLVQLAANGLHLVLAIFSHIITNCY